MPIGARRDMRLAATHAMRASIEVVNAMYTLAGGTSVYDSSPLQRHLRDVHVASQHITVGSHTLEVAGQLLLGVDANTSAF
jgi:alkylation response protein AidB-like acyl-CoA dehydrogenase